MSIGDPRDFYPYNCGFYGLAPVAPDRVYIEKMDRILTEKLAEVLPQGVFARLVSIQQDYSTFDGNTITVQLRIQVPLAAESIEMPIEPIVVKENLEEPKKDMYLSSKIKVLVDGKVVGKVQSIDVDDSAKSIKMIDEPDLMNKIKVTANRIRFDRNRVAEAFSRGIVTVKGQRKPLQIAVEDRFGSEARDCVNTRIKNCWIGKMGRSYTVSDFVVVENVELYAEDVEAEVPKWESVYEKAAREMQEEEDKRFLSLIDDEQYKSFAEPTVSGVDLGVGKSKTVIVKGRSVGKSTEIGANAILREAVFETEGVGPLAKSEDFYIPGKIKASAIMGSKMAIVTPDGGVTCKKCNDFNEYCNSPSETDGTHICYKCRNGY